VINELKEITVVCSALSKFKMF